jgi:hypothetical protein
VAGIATYRKPPHWLLQYRKWFKEGNTFQRALNQATFNTVGWAFAIMFFTGLGFFGVNVGTFDGRRPINWILLPLVFILWYASTFLFEHREPVGDDWLLWDKANERERVKH